MRAKVGKEVVDRISLFIWWHPDFTKSDFLYTTYITSCYGPESASDWKTLSSQQHVSKVETRHQQKQNCSNAILSI